LEEEIDYIMYIAPILPTNTLRASAILCINLLYIIYFN